MKIPSRTYGIWMHPNTRHMENLQGRTAQVLSSILHRAAASATSSAMSRLRAPPCACTCIMASSDRPSSKGSMPMTSCGTAAESTGDKEQMATQQGEAGRLGNSPQISSPLLRCLRRTRAGGLLQLAVKRARQQWRHSWHSFRLRRHTHGRFKQRFTHPAQRPSHRMKSSSHLKPV